MAFTPVRFTATAVITAALADINALAQGETATAAEAQDCLRRLNALVSQLRLQEFTIPFLSREGFALVADQAAYTIGPLGEFVTQRPQSLYGAGLQLLAVDDAPATEIPLGILTDDAYEAIQVKDLSNSQPTQVYYSATYADGLGQIWLWPTPDTADNSLVLYLSPAVDGFDDLVTEYDFPPGYFDLFEYGLALRLLAPYGFSNSATRGDLQAQFATASTLVKRQNVSRNDMPMDPGAVIGGRGSVYNILSGGYN
jgi:hypothetical protein